MEWTDTGIVIDVRPHAETAAVVQLLTAGNGRVAGLVHGGRGRRMRPVLQVGNRVTATWRARLSEHLGALTLEADLLRAGMVLEDAGRVDALMALSALCVAVLPEREPHAGVYQALDQVLDAVVHTDVWPALIVKWEAGLLTDLGYGLALDQCALTGATDDLTHVSPNSGRAVCGRAREAEPYLDKLLALPPFLLGNQAALAPGDVAAGFALTGHFLNRRILWPANRQLPEARARLVDRLIAAGEA